MRRVGHIGDRGAVELGLSGQRVDRFLRCRDAAVMADIGNPAVALMMDPRLIGAAPLQIVVADEAHIAGLGLVLSERGSADVGERQRPEERDNADHCILPKGADYRRGSQPAEDPPRGAHFVLPERLLGRGPIKVAVPASAPDILRWEVGGGQAPRQPGQVRKEAAVTSSGLGRLFGLPPHSFAPQ